MIKMSLRGKSGGSGFIHSVKVPRIYKTASSIVKRVVENGESLKNLVYNTRHKNVKGVYALVVETIKHSQTLNELIKKSKLLEKEIRLEPWLARVLITEMIFRKKDLKGSSKPVQTIINYHKEFLKHFSRKRNCESIKQVRKPRYVRVNTLHHTPDELVKIFRSQGWIFIQTCSDYDAFISTIAQLGVNEFTKDFHVKELLVFPSTAQFYKNELYINGSIILQDKASCLPVSVLQPPPNTVVLDMCSAPGMKTSHLSAVMKNKGTIYAVERNASRYKALCDFIKSVGCNNVVPINMDALSIGRKDSCSATVNPSWYKDVEYILLDPSCSGTGMVERKNIFINEKMDNMRIKKLCGFQYKLLLHALTGFPNLKRAVYCTCSVLPVENEKVVEDVLRKLSERKHTDNEFNYELIEIMKDSWQRRGSDHFKIGRYCLCANPENDYTNGFFIAVFQRLNLCAFMEEEDTGSGAMIYSKGNCLNLPVAESSGISNVCRSIQTLHTTSCAIIECNWW